jgi:2-aminoethylphosphonate-pyruvate transaminase
VRLSYRETTMPRASDVAKNLDEDRNISHVWLAHVETSTGMLNPVQDIAQVVKAKGRIMMLDATASFGGIPLHMVKDHIDILVSTANRCLESVPGITFILARRDLLETSAGQSHSQALDLNAEWLNEKMTDQFRFMPPTHVIMALHEALRELEAEGGVGPRNQRYQRNAETLRQRMKALGFSLLLADVEASPVVQTILAPRSATFDFSRFYHALSDMGFAVAAGRLPQRPSFRIGCIGHLNEKVMQQAVVAIENVMHDMDVRSFAPGDQ